MSLQGVHPLLWATIYKDKMDDAESDSTDPETVQMRKIIKSVGWAQDNFASYPLLLFAFDRNDSTVVRSSRRSGRRCSQPR